MQGDVRCVGLRGAGSLSSRRSHSEIGGASRCPGARMYLLEAGLVHRFPARWLEARKPWVWRSPSRSGGIGQVNPTAVAIFRVAPIHLKAKWPGSQRGRKVRVLAQDCGDGSGDVFCMHTPFYLCRRNMMMNFPLFLLAIYLGTSPVLAQETQPDSTRSERPTFSMTPT